MHEIKSASTKLSESWRYHFLVLCESSPLPCAKTTKQKNNKIKVNVALNKMCNDIYQINNQIMFLVF